MTARTQVESLPLDNIQKYSHGKELKIVQRKAYVRGMTASALLESLPVANRT